MPKKKKIYLSGLISDGGKLSDGDIESNKELFFKAENSYSKKGYIVINPLKLHTIRRTWEEYMFEDIRVLFSCQEICMLSNWRKSKGARIEFAIARELGIKIRYYQT